MAVAALSLAMLYALPANAVHDDGLFELDGNTVNTATAGDDWSNLYNAGANKAQGTPAPTVQACTSVITTSCFEAYRFIGDKAAGDTSYFTGGGSKDRENISSWLFGPNDQAPDKNDITNAYAAAYQNSDGDTQLYFGSDRFAVNGDAQMGFWFFQNQVCLAGTTTAGVTCPNTNPGKFVDPTTGDPAVHVDGDILVLVNFNNGGALGLAGVYAWTGGANGAPEQVLFGTGADCATIGTGDDFCSSANTALLTNEPSWPYTGKGRNVTSYLTSAFIEGGVDLGAITGAGSCFSTFLAETRSSSGPSTGLSLDAQLKDLAMGTFERCGATLTTTPKDGAGNAIPAGGLSIGSGSVTAKDFANLDVSGIDTWSGNLKFFLCGPIATNATCNTGGVQIGPAAGVTVNQDSTAADFTSAAATLTSAANGTTAAPGRYCWRGVFTSATSGVPNQSDSSAGECFSVNPVQPALDTQAVASSVNFGQSIGDNATLGAPGTPTATQPGTNGPNATYPTINATNGAAAGGKITFTLLGPDDCTTVTSNSTTAGDTNPQDITTISGDGTYGPVSYTPGAPGTYHWKAQYIPATGDPNNLGSTHNASCDDTDEDVVVNQVQTSVATRQFVYPQDKAVVSATGGGNLAGSLTFKLYGPTGGGTPQTAAQNCADNGDTVGSGGLLYKEGPLSVSGASPQSKATNNTSVRVDVDATVVWRVTYTSTNPAQLGGSSVCVESTAVDFTGDDGTISLP